MPRHIAIGPVTRIEGHLDIEVTIDAVDGVQRVIDARCAGTMFRGVDLLLQGRHPRDAVHITSRVCGVCPTSHALAASLALESAYGSHAAPPGNGRILRNLLLGADFLRSHLLHFYQLTLLDYVDGSGVLHTSPPPAGSPAPDLIRGEEACEFLDNYLKALDVLRKVAHTAAIFGGRMPCTPVIVPGGCTPHLSDVPNIATRGEPNASERIKSFRETLNQIRGFIAEVYLPDVRRLAKRFPDYFRIGRGPGNLLAFGGFSDMSAGTAPLLPGGSYADGQTSPLDTTQITESIARARYAGDKKAIAPAQSVTQPDIEKPGAYSWIKAPRYQNQAFEVGPLARMWIAGHYRQGISVMDRLMARAVEAEKIADAMAAWLQELKTEQPSRERFHYSSSGEGTGMTEAPRGALGHWVQFDDGAIRRYQIIAPTAWNASPEDESGQKGPIEQALIGTLVRDRTQPIELLRVVHSFDPCLACSVH